MAAGAEVTAPAADSRKTVRDVPQRPDHCGGGGYFAALDRAA
jgi:hypothetical protein